MFRKKAVEAKKEVTPAKVPHASSLVPPVDIPLCRTCQRRPSVGSSWYCSTECKNGGDAWHKKLHLCRVCSCRSVIGNQQECSPHCTAVKLNAKNGRAGLSKWPIALRERDLKHQNDRWSWYGNDDQPLRTRSQLLESGEFNALVIKAYEARQSSSVPKAAVVVATATATTPSTSTDDATTSSSSAVSASSSSSSWPVDRCRAPDCHESIREVTERTLKQREERRKRTAAYEAERLAKREKMSATDRAAEEKNDKKREQERATSKAHALAQVKAAAALEETLPKVTPDYCAECIRWRTSVSSLLTAISPRSEIGRHEFLRKQINASDLPSKMIAPLISIVVEYAADDRRLSLWQTMDIGMPLCFFESNPTQNQGRTWWWKECQVVYLSDTTVGVAIRYDDRFSRDARVLFDPVYKETTRYPSECIEYVSIWDDYRLHPLGTHRDEYGYEHYEYPCWTDSALVTMADGSERRISEIQVGDDVLSPHVPVDKHDKGVKLDGTTRVQRVTRVHHARHNAQLNMVSLTRNCVITPGHPIFINDHWMRPDEYARKESRYVEGLYNLTLDGSHTVMVDGVICCTIGRECGDRLRSIHPLNRQYGPAALGYHDADSDHDDDDHDHE